MTRVVVALIESRGKVLICRRRQDQKHPGKWEFPGGKLEQGETLRQALSREVLEELGIDVKPGKEITTYKHQYPGEKEIELSFFHIKIAEQEVDKRQFSEIRWEPVHKLQLFDFLEGDVKFIGELVGGKSK